MKKLLVVLGVVAFGFAFTSCKKECKCTADGKDFPLVGTQDSKDLCDAFQKLYEGTDAPIKCEWK